jgi:dihydropteroate synthase
MNGLIKLNQSTTSSSGNVLAGYILTMSKSFKSDGKTVLKCRNLPLDLSTPKVMGILNTTPDSFYDGGSFYDPNKAVDRIAQMIEQGADIIDIGGQSTRPGADVVSLEEELSRTVPVLEAAIPNFPETLFSIDTTRYEVALEANRLGVHIINDVSGLQKEPRFADLCAEFDMALVIMHSKGEPKTMQDNPEYEDVLAELVEFLDKQVTYARRIGVQSIIVDPGIGFGKTMEHNIEILSQLKVLHRWGAPILVGASRKSIIGTILNNRPVEGRLAGTLALHYDALVRGAKILRVHDIQEAKDTILVYNALRLSPSQRNSFH